MFYNIRISRSLYCKIPFFGPQYNITNSRSLTISYSYGYPIPNNMSWMNGPYYIVYAI